MLPGLGSKCLSPLSHLTVPTLFFFMSSLLLYLRETRPADAAEISPYLYHNFFRTAHNIQEPREEGHTDTDRIRTPRKESRTRNHQPPAPQLSYRSPWAQICRWSYIPPDEYRYTLVSNTQDSPHPDLPVLRDTTSRCCNMLRILEAWSH